MRRWAPPTRYMLRRITASTMNDLIWDLSILAVNENPLEDFP